MADLKIVLAVDSNNPVVGDLYLDPAGQIVLTGSLAEGVAQQLYIRFNFFQGEWFLDPTQGFPWFQQILGFKIPQSIAAQLFKRLITTCPGVAAITLFDLKRVAIRAYQLTFQCMLTDGTTLTSGDFSAFVVGSNQ